MPGAYTVQLHIGDKLIASQTFTIKKDPRLVDVSQNDLVAQFELIQTINAKLDTTHKAINKIRKATEEMKSLVDKIEDNKELNNRLKKVAITISEIEQQLVQTNAEAIQDVLNFPIRLNNKLAALKNTVAVGYGKPTAQQYAVFEDLATKVDVQLNKLETLWNGDYEQVIQEIEQPAIPIE